MKLVLTAILSLFAWSNLIAQESSSPARRVDITPGYVEYGNISFRDEKVMLDRWAAKLRQSPGSVIWILAYDGRQTCVGEAEAHTARAKNYLVKKHGIRAGRVILADGGFRGRLTVELWLRSRSEIPPAASPTIDPADVEFIRGCNSRRRGRS